MPPGRVDLTTGTDALRCLSLSSKVLRWYSDCCRTPIANTPARPGFPVIGMIHSFMDHEADGRSRDVVLGPPLCRIYESSAADQSILDVCCKSSVIGFTQKDRQP
jgi:hypothetical protein